MSENNRLGRRNEAEVRAALEAFEQLEAAESEEAIAACFARIPRWVFTEIPVMREMIQRLVPVALGSLKELASQGHPEAGETLMDVLEANPHLQSSFPQKPN